jgi:hypothetical protein
VGTAEGSASQRDSKGRRFERRGDRARREEHLRTLGEEGGAAAASPESIEGAAGSRPRSACAEMWSGIEIRMRESKTLIDCSGRRGEATPTPVLLPGR